MGIDLFDRTDRDIRFSVNFWHWRAIVEAIRSTYVLPSTRVDQLHESFVGELSKFEATGVGKALRDRVIPQLSDSERLLDETTIGQRDAEDFQESAETSARNDSIDKDVLGKFAEFCLNCEGFQVT